MSVTLLKKSRINNSRREKDLRKRDRLQPCLNEYDLLLKKLRKKGVEEPEIEAMSYLTSILRNTYTVVLKQIKASGKEGISAINSIKRSAGTNFQGLCEYAILQWLKTTDMPFCIGPNAPKSMKEELTIFGKDADNGDFSVEPDIDISLGWIKCLL